VAFGERNQRFSEGRQDAQQHLSLIGLETKALAELGPNYGDLTRRTIEYHVQRETMLRLRQLDNEELRDEQRLNELGLSQLDLVIEKEKLYQQTLERREQIPDEVRRQMSAQAQLNDTRTLVEAQRTIQVDMWRSLDSTAHDTFRSIFDSGKSAFERLRDTLKNTLFDLLYQMTLRPFLIQVVTTVAGSDVAKGAFGAAATQQQSGSPLGALKDLPLSDLLPKGFQNQVKDFFGFGSAALGSSGTASLAVGSAIDAGALFGSGAASGVGNFASSFDAVGGLGSFGADALSGAVETGSLFGTIGSEGVGLASDAAGAALGAAASYVPYIGAAIKLLQGDVKGAIGTAAGAYIGSLIFPGIGTAVGAVLGSLLSGLGGGKPPAVGTGYQFLGDYTPGVGVTNLDARGHYQAGDRTGFDAMDPESHRARFNAAIDPTFELFSEIAKKLKLDASTIGTTSFDFSIGGIGQAADDASKPGVAGQLFNRWAEALLPSLKDLAKEGEAAAQTFVRLTDEVTVVDKLMGIMGKDSVAIFGNVAAASIGMKDALVQAMGGLDQAAQLTDFFYRNFFDKATQAATGLQLVEGALTALGVTAIPKTREQFRELVEAQDLTTDAGRKMFSELLKLAPAFAAVTAEIEETVDSIASLQDQVATQRDVAIKEMQDQLQASRSTAQQAHTNAAAYRDASRSMQDAIKDLRQSNLTTLLPGAKLNEARGNLDDVFQKVLSGDKAASAQLPQLAQSFLGASREYNASSDAYVADFDRVMQMLTQAGVASDAFAGEMDYQATLLDVQTGVLQAMLDNLQSPDPNTALLNQQVGILSGVRDLLADSSRNLTTINSSIVGQTGYVIAGNSMISSQTGEIIALPRLIGQQDLNVHDAALRSTINVSDPGAQALLDHAAALLGQNGPLAAGNYALQDATGRVFQATVNSAGAVTALQEITRGTNRLIDTTNQLSNSQTRDLITANSTLNTTTREVVQGVDETTGRIERQTSTTDAIRNLQARATDTSAQMLIQLAANSTTQSSQFATMVDGINRTVVAMNTLIGLQQQLNQAEAARQAQAQADAAKAAQVATSQAALSSAAAQRQTIAGGINTGIQRIRNLAAKYGVQLQDADGTPAYFRLNEQTGQFESNYNQIAGNAAAFEAFKNEFWAPGGVYDQTFGAASQYSALTQQIQTLRDLITSLGAIPSHAGGLDYVPYDGYLARLHKGEYIAAASEASEWRAGMRSNAGAGVSVDYLDRLCAAVNEARDAIERASARSSRDVKEQTTELAGSYVEGAREMSRAEHSRSKAQRRRI
jgi:hypothetical protein